jgi:hypothetical protein
MTPAAPSSSAIAPAQQHGGLDRSRRHGHKEDATSCIEGTAEQLAPLPRRRLGLVAATATLVAVFAASGSPSRSTSAIGPRTV